MIVLKIFLLHASDRVLVLRGNYYSVVFMGDIYMGQRSRAVCIEQT